MFLFGIGALAMLSFSLYLIADGGKKRYVVTLMVGIFWAGFSLFMIAAVLKGTGWFDGSESSSVLLPPRDFTEQDISAFLRYADNQQKLWNALWQWSVALALGYVLGVLFFTATGYLKKIRTPLRNAVLVFGFVLAFGFMIYCGNRSLYWTGADYEMFLEYLAKT